MADLTYKVTVDTAQAQKNLGGLKSALGAVAAAFSVRAIVQFGDGITNLQNKLRTISTDSEDVARQFAAIGQIADRNRTSLTATGDLFFKIARSLDVLGISQRDAAILTDSISKGLTLSGASAEGAASAIYQLGQAFGANVLRGEELNAVLENAPVLTTVLAESLGVTVGELRKLGEQGKLTGELVAQAFIKANAQLTESFSKTVPTVAQSLERLQTNLGKLFVSIGGGEALSTLAEAVGAVADAMQPLGQFIKENGDALATLAKIVAAVAGSYLLFAKVIPQVAAAQNALFLQLGRGGSAFKTLQNGIIGIVAGLKNFGLNLGKALGIVAGGFNTFQYLTAAVGSLLKVFLRFAGVVGIVYAVAEGVDFLLKKLQVNFSILGTLGDAYEWLKGKLFGTEQATQAQVRATDNAIDALNTQANSVKQVAKVTEEQAKAIRDTVRGYQESAEAQLANLRIANQLIGATEEQRNLTQALQEAENNYYNTRRSLIEQLTKAREDAAGKESEAVSRILTELERLDKAYVANGRTIQELIAQQENLTRARQLEEYRIAQEIQINQQLRRIQDNMAKIGLTNIERGYYDIAAAARESARAAIEAEEARRGSKLDPKEAEQYYKKAAEGARRLITENRRLSEQSRTFATGWNRAFRQYVEDATNAAAKAERMFAKFTQGLEDLIVDFAKTGKFEWKRFVEGMLEELLRSQIRETIASIGQALGLGGLFGGGSAQNRGGTPSNPLYVLDVSGAGNSVGGDLQNLIGAFTQQGRGNVLTPGGGFGGGTNQGGGFIETIGKVAGSLGGTLSKAVGGIGSVIQNAGSWLNKNIFGGFFANGGTLGAGKIGIVGERGPELIKGPGTITPVMPSQVTYNINAVDAASFQALVARDPAFIYSVTQQGARTIANRR